MKYNHKIIVFFETGHRVIHKCWKLAELKTFTKSKFGWWRWESPKQFSVV